MHQFTLHRLGRGRLLRGHRAALHHDALILVVMKGESHGPMGETRGCTVGTIKSRLNRARNLINLIMVALDETEVWVQVWVQVQVWV